MSQKKAEGPIGRQPNGQGSGKDNGQSSGRDSGKDTPSSSMRPGTMRLITGINGMQGDRHYSVSSTFLSFFLDRLSTSWITNPALQDP